MDFTNEETGSTDWSDKDSELNLNILEEHFEEINVDPVGFDAAHLTKI